jgi:phosphatidylglycerophosphate synthase
VLDRHIKPMLDPLLNRMAKPLAQRGWQADQVTWLGFAIGMLAVPLLWLNWLTLALICVLLNRFADGLDGALARQTQATDAGGFLDISLDFIFYQAVVLGFALAFPQVWLPAMVLMFTFVLTGVTFLAFAVMAERHQLSTMAYPNKSIYYLGGLAEGTETILFFVVILIWPTSFAILAWLFAALCFVTAVIRLHYGYRTLKDLATNHRA